MNILISITNLETGGAQMFDNDYAVMKSAIDILQIGTPVNKNIDNLRIAGGSDVMVAALAYYQSVKRASEMGVPGAKSIYEDLRKRFPGAPDEDGGTPPPPPPPTR